MNMKNKLYFLTVVPLFSLLIAICSWISIPAVIPFTMQTFALFLSLIVIGGKMTFASVMVYITLGAVGLPVFTLGSGGIAYLLGPTGGYIFGMVIASLIVWGGERIFRKRIIILDIVLLSLGLICIYALGSVWYTAVYSTDINVGFGVAVMTCVVPFVIPDIIKLGVAVSIGKRLKNLITKLDRS